MEKNITSVKILGMEYKISCLPEEASQVEEAAVYLNNKLQEVRNNSKIDEGRASIIAALNITNEHLKSLSIKTDEPDSTLKIKELSEMLQNQIDSLSKINL